MENKGQVIDNKGNVRPEILFTAKSGTTKVFLTATGIYYQFSKIEYPKGFDRNNFGLAKNMQKDVELPKQIKHSVHRFTLELQDANQQPEVFTDQQSDYTENFYLAQCPNGIKGIHGYEKITFKNVYPNIDWVVFSKEGFMEYDFLIHPGGNPSQIRLKIKDAESVNLTSQGELLIKTSLGEVREKAPVSYADGKLIPSHYKQFSNGTIGFAVKQQSGKELKIDPMVTWSKYSGGDDGSESGQFTTVDHNGNIIVAGIAGSTYGLASGGFQTFIGGINDAFLMKYNSIGTLLWATYYGGSELDWGHSCAVDFSNNIYLCGRTSSTSAIASGGFQNTYIDGTAAFLVKFNTNGGRIWGTYYGGNNTYGYSCVVDRQGNVCMAGSTRSATNIASGGFQNTYGGDQDAFLVKFSSTGNRLWSTYYGGIKNEDGASCVIDSLNNIYLTGTTYSSNNISFAGFQDTLKGMGDAYLVKFNSYGSRLWATYFGGNDYDISTSSSIDNNGNIYLSGVTYSTTGLAFGGFQNTYKGDGALGDAYLVKFSQSGNRIWATYYGGNSQESSMTCAVDSTGNVYISGTTRSANFIYSGIGFQETIANPPGDYDEGFLAKFNGSGSRLWGTYFGGNNKDVVQGCAAGPNNIIYITGSTYSSDFSYTGGFQNPYNGTGEGFIAAIEGFGGEPIATSLCGNDSIILTCPIVAPFYGWQEVRGGNDIQAISNYDHTYFEGQQTKTLKIKRPPTGWYGYKYRCVATYSLYHSVISESFELKFVNTWIGTAGSAWENNANWSCGTIPDGNTDVIINTGPVVLNSNGICRTLTIRPSVSFTVTSGHTLTITH